MVNPVNLNLNTARAELTQGLRQQETRVADAARDINNSFARAQNEVSRASDTEQTPPPVQARVSDNVEISPEAEVAQQNEASVVESMVDLKQASTAYLANLKAMEAVNDMERESVDILK